MSDKKLKCKKCGIYFKDRNDPEEMRYDVELCMVCKSIIQMLRITIDALGRPSEFHGERVISINMEDIHIRKP